ncbi:hypothetical protein HXX76_001785 [Chlamydomonas incerta]|uniref:Uncharacterized protein n=1 Tax=Chlamydomonas incerta TaxID=51695 RepID=A0A835W7I3_CHLIN|nr:hypothetical protein HXX76_001785 [Chlamydomonas incerta]|eukprot:KAG2443427.1 hypothetical protein HXX76_001785 [Chlamydomonas incerta]
MNNGVQTGALLDSLEGTAAYNNIVPFPLPENQEVALPTCAGSSAAPAPPKATTTATPKRFAKFAVGPVWGPAWIPTKLPGPTASESSGLDFVDLFDMPLPEVMARVDDAATFRMLGCTRGALHRVPAAAGSPAQPAPPAAININAMTRLRNAWIRNVSPVVALSVRNAIIADRIEKQRKAQALLDEQKAACAGLGSSSSSAASPVTCKAGGGGAAVKCRFVSAGHSQAAAATSPTHAAAPCGNGGGSERAEAFASAAPGASTSSFVSGAGSGAVGTNIAPPEAEQQQAASPATSVGAPSCTADSDMDVTSQRSSSSGAHCGGRRRGSRSRGLSGAGRQQGGQGGAASWI